MRYYHPTKEHHIVTLALAAVLIAGGFFAYDSMGSSHVQAADSAVEAETTSSQPNILNTEQTALLKKIEDLKLDGLIFQDKAFSSLQDWEVTLGTQEAGKVNPFAPLGGTAPAQTNTKKTTGR